MRDTVVSMTGFGAGRMSGQNSVFGVEMKGVNHRFLEIVVHMPREWIALEDRVKKLVRRFVRRGRVDVFITFQALSESGRTVKLDKGLALEYDSRLKEMASLLGVPYGANVEYLASCPDVLAVETKSADLEGFWPLLEGALKQAAEQFAGMRKTEGHSLAEDLWGKVGEMDGRLSVIATRAPEVVDEYRARLEQRLQQLAGEDPLMKDSRVAQEVALMADRMSIEEEVTRLRSHLGQFGKALGSGEAVGRRLDFLVQEMNRELNTVGAKAGDLLIAQCVVDAKSLVENIKEQIQNLE
ncbi:MAG: YicC family protein [Peptococcaceae bacterium]|nr:YicC family protein [Peptococcaceae bacterium]